MLVWVKTEIGKRLSEKSKQIIERLKKGESGSAIAREYGISRQAVSQLKLKYLCNDKMKQKEVEE